MRRYLNITTIQIRDSQITIELDALGTRQLPDRVEPLLKVVDLCQDLVVDEDLKPEDLALLHCHRHIHLRIALRTAALFSTYW